MSASEKSLSEWMAAMVSGFAGTPAPPVWYDIPEIEQQAVTGKRAGSGPLGVNPHHRLCRITEAHARHRGKGVRVGVVDTGCEARHPDLAPVLRDVRDGTGEGVARADPNGHGTHCSGIIAGQGTAQAPEGVVPELDGLYVYAGLTAGGSGRSDVLAAGIDWCVAQGCDVISCSWGGPGIDSYGRAAVDRAVAAGRSVVAAAGNDGQRGNIAGDIGQYERCLCVAAVDDDGRLAAFSTRGPFVDAAACGVQVLSTYPGSRYARLSGTSMATPQLAGCVALTLAYLRSKVSPQITAQQAEQLVRKMLTDLPPNGRDSGTGGGYPDMVAIFDAIDRGASQPPPAKPPEKPRRVYLDWTLVGDSLRLVQPQDA